MWNRLALYVLRLLGTHDPSPGPENEADGNINLCCQMEDEEADSATATGGDYDVFLSFRGPDTRNTFTDCLYAFMCQAGIRVYRDNEELQPGDKILEILRAVKSSQIYIPIFSRNYASSKWCLEELACMVESTRRSTGKKMLPIFFDVDPLDVKLETKLYKSALNKLEEKYGCTRVEPWKNALTDVARIKGWHLKDRRHGEAMIDITQKVSQKIAIRKRYLPTNLVGIDDRIEDIKKLLNFPDASDVRFVIIYGIGGIGKTTLAKAVFNLLSPRFEGHSFLSNTQELSPYGSIAKMQRKLLADLFSFSLAETFDFEEGNNIIRSRLRNKQVLLVFDGMDENDQFMQLATHCTLCGPRSRIIITTREKSIFPMTKVGGLEENISVQSTKFFPYEMKEMHFDHALRLFNKLAFNTDSAPRDLDDLSREVVELTGGLPLALEVIGSHLRTQSKNMWRGTLENLKEVPHEKVQERLKISYDALKNRAKQIFLDIACFFSNKKKTNPMYMWEDCGFFPKVEIEVLINKSLIKIVDRDRIWMHDQLRAFGREIIRQDRSKLWLLEMAQGTENAIALPRRESGHNFTRKDFANLTSVRFLELDGGNFAGNFEDILSELRWLCWRNCPPKFEANSFVLNHLVVLKLSGNIIIEEWSKWVEIMVPSKLKVLNLAGCESLIKTPSFSKFVSLERLVLKDFPKLAEIDSSIGKLEQLNYLKIKWCPRLRGLPQEVGYLTALRELILIQCFRVRSLPYTIGNLRDLSRLVMEDSGLVVLPRTIGGLVALEYMSLVNCTSLKRLPTAVGKLRRLTELDLSGTTFKLLHPSVCSNQDLAIRKKNSEIRARRGPKDKAVWKSAPYKWSEVPLQIIPQKLMLSYDALGHEAKQVFLDIACFFVHEKISIAMYMWEACQFCPKDQIDVLINKSLISKDNLDRIWMNYKTRDLGKEIVRREDIRNPGNRSRLWFSEMALDVVRAKKGTKNVVALTLWTKRHNFTREDFANFTNVRFLELKGGNFAGNFEDILPELRWLCWRNCPLQLQANNFVLNHLVVLKLSGNITTEEWSRWVEIMVPSKLKVLHLARSKSLIKTPSFSEFLSLERLVLQDFPRLAEIDPSIGKLGRLIYVEIKRCPCLRELPREIGCASGLRELILTERSSVCYLPDSIGNLRLLSRLVMKDVGLFELPDTIKGLVDLEYLCLANCTHLNSLPDAVGELKSLTELDLSWTTIEELPPSLWNLEALRLVIDGSEIEIQLMSYRDLMRYIEFFLNPGARIELTDYPFYLIGPKCRYKGGKTSVRLPDYPMEILNQGSSTVVAPGFHEHHFSGRCPTKISARVFFSGASDSRIKISAEFPLWDTGIMSSCEPILYFKNLILLLVSWLERKRVSKWMHDFQRKGEALLSLEFCNHCMSITSENGGFSPSPLCLEYVDPCPQLSIMVSMTLDNYGYSTVENLEILTKFSLPGLRSHSLLLKGPCSSEKLQYSIRMFNLWHEKATRVQGSASRRSFKNCKRHRLRKTRWGRSRNKRKRNLSDRLCLDEYLDKRLLMYSGYFYACQYSLSPLPKTKLDYCHYVLEQAFAVLDGPLDFKRKTRLIRVSASVVEWLREAIDVETPTVQEAYQFFKDMYIGLFC